MSEFDLFRQWRDHKYGDSMHKFPLEWFRAHENNQFEAWQARADIAEQRIRELESWIPQAYKEGFLDGRDDEGGDFDTSWEVSMAKMVFDEKMEPPR